MKQRIVLIGGGGHCKSCIDVIEQQGVYQIAGIVDLPEGVSVNAKIVGVEPTPEAVKVGMKVELELVKVRTNSRGQDVMAYQFRPVRS